MHRSVLSASHAFTPDTPGSYFPHAANFRSVIRLCLSFLLRCHHWFHSTVYNRASISLGSKLDHHNSSPTLASLRLRPDLRVLLHYLGCLINLHHSVGCLGLAPISTLALVNLLSLLCRIRASSAPGVTFRGSTCGKSFWRIHVRSGASSCLRRSIYGRSLRSGVCSRRKLDRLHA